jgi:hypothetical protein
MVLYFRPESGCVINLPGAYFLLYPPSNWDPGEHSCCQPEEKPLAILRGKIA